MQATSLDMIDLAGETIEGDRKMDSRRLCKRLRSESRRLSCHTHSGPSLSITARLIAGMDALIRSSSGGCIKAACPRARSLSGMDVASSFGSTTKSRGEHLIGSQALPAKFC